MFAVCRSTKNLRSCLLVRIKPPVRPCLIGDARGAVVPVGPMRSNSSKTLLYDLDASVAMPSPAPPMSSSQPPAANRLPTPDENPEADIVIFDGNCRFCRAQVERLARWDGKGRRLAFLSLHDPEVAKRFPDLTYDQLMEEMYVVDRLGRRHGGAAAIRYLSRRLPRLYILAPLLHLPFCLPLWRWAYRTVAKRRYWLGGPATTCDDEACRIHQR